MARHAERFFPPGFLMSFEKPELKGTEQGLQPSPCHYINFPSVQPVHQNCFKIDSTDLNCENKRTLILYCNFYPREIVLMLLWGPKSPQYNVKNPYVFLQVLCWFFFFPPYCCPPWTCHPLAVKSRSPFCNMWLVVRKTLKIMHLPSSQQLKLLVFYGIYAATGKFKTFGISK